MNTLIKLFSGKKFQYFFSIGFVAFVAMAAFATKDILGYHIVALLLLVTVSLLAMAFDIRPVLLSAVLSALIWNYFFIPPIFTFHVELNEDWLMFLMYFVVALLNAVLTFKIRQAEKRARDKEERDKTIKLYNTLLNSLSHELRTPIATILGSVDALKENRDQLSTQNRMELLSQMDNASMRLDRQVENLLNMSRVESGMLQLKKDWCDVNEMVYSILNKLNPISENHPLEFEPDESLPLYKLDAVLIEDVLYNILYNAILYTPPLTQINIEASHRGEECCITISDNGEGFPEEEIEHAFEKFYRVPGTSAGGTGLGLSIAKGFIEAHGGTIKLSNRPQGGARFTIHLPVEYSFVNRLKND